MVLLLVSTLVEAGQSPGTLSHPGAIVNVKGEPIPGAQATAYRVQANGPGGACPIHTDQLHQTKSDGQGNFTFLIPTQHTSYFAVYCANNYQARPVPGNENVRNNVRVRPDPVKLYPTEGAKGQDPTTTAHQAMVLVLEDASNDLQYFRGADPSGFTSADITSTDRRLVEDLLKRPRPEVPVRPVARPTPLVARQAILSTLDAASGDLRYFDIASKGIVQDTIPKLSGADQAVVRLLLTRTP